jgi:hypothetical protein
MAVTRRGPLLLAAGAAASPLTWFAAQQGAGGMTYFACRSAPPVGLALAALGLLACVAAVAVAWQAARGAGATTGAFAARVVVGMAVLFAFADLLTAAALALIPPCAR